MRRRLVLIALAAVALVGALLWLAVGRWPGGEEMTEPEVASPPPTPTPAPEQRLVLLFAAGDGLLEPELRTLPVPLDVAGRVRVVVEQLLAGSRVGLEGVFPYPAELRAVFVDGRGTAFVDLSAPPEPLAGSHQELLLAYGVVDSILLNCPELGSVQLLFGGEEVATLTGHLDLSRPLPLNRHFIAPS